MISKFISDLYDIKIGAFIEIEKNLKNEDRPWHREECTKLSKFKLILGGIFLLPFRAIGFGFCICCWVIASKWNAKGSDPTKPYSAEVRNRIIKSAVFWNKLIIFYWSLSTIDVVKVRI